MPATEPRDPHAVLGVARGASAAEIRDAYRRLANELHPDRAGEKAAARMAEVNDAYRRLRADPALGPRSSAVAPGSAPAAPPASAYVVEPQQRARVPWRAMLVFAAIGSVAVVVAAQFIDAPEEPRPDNLLGPGSCVTIAANGDAGEVTCRGEGDAVVQSLVGFEDQCPPGTTAHRDRQGRGWACIAGR